MKILLVVADLGLGGAQQVVINLANGFAEKGHKVAVWDVYPELRLDGVVGKISKSVDLIGVTPSSTPSGLWDRLINSIAYRLGINKQFWREKQRVAHDLALKQWVNNYRPEVVNSHVWWADKWVYENRNWLPDNWWITMHGSYLELARNYKDNLAVIKDMKVVADSASGFIYLSDRENAYLREKFKISNPFSYKIYNGVPEDTNDLSNFTLNNCQEHRNPILLCASRAIKEKGWEELILAAIALHSVDYKFDVWFAGDGPMLPEWKQKYADLEFIHFLSYRNDIMELIEDSDVVVLPSFEEALPTIILESYSKNKPFIATEVGEIVEIGRIIGLEEFNAIVPIEPRDEIVQNLALSIKSLLDRDNYLAYQKAMKASNLDFSIDNQVAEYEKLFKAR